MGSIHLLSSWQCTAGPIPFSKHGTENPGEEKTGFSLSSRQQTDQCVAANVQLAQRWCLPVCGFPLRSKLSPIQVQNRCKNPGRPALLAAHRTSLKAEWQAVEQMFTLGSNYSHTVVYRFAFSALAKKDAHFFHAVLCTRDWTRMWWYFLIDISKLLR